MIGILISLLILAVVLWNISLLLDMILPQMGAPVQMKMIILAIVGLIGLVSILGGYRITL